MVRFFAAAVVCFWSFAVAAQGIPANSTWVNERGSTLSVSSVDSTTNRFTGTYINKATGFQCQGTPYDVAGGVTGNRVSFTVVWKNTSADCRTITIWRGRLAGKTIKTRWELVYVDQQWRFKKLRGADTFTQQ